MTRRIMLPLADDTTETLCGSCSLRGRLGECDVFGDLLPADDGDDHRSEHCINSELQPETIETIRAELFAPQYSAAMRDFERVFGGES